MHSARPLLNSSSNLARTCIFIAILVVTVLAPLLVCQPAHAATGCRTDEIRYPGAGWLQGAGVDICGTGGGGKNYVDNKNGDPTQTGAKWQCVEMINRLYLLRGWTVAFWRGNGDTLAKNIPPGLSKQDNGHISYINPGDIITLDGPNGGHAAVVNSVTATTINLISQNAREINSTASIQSGLSSDENILLRMDGWRNYSIQSIIHRPGGTNKSASDTTPGVVRKDGPGLRWHLRNSNNGGPPDRNFIFGLSATDKPIAGDWDGNGTTTPGVVRKDGAGWHWYLRNDNSSGPTNYDFIYGLSATDTPVVGDWDGNGKATIGIVRKDGAGWLWHLRNSNDDGVADLSFAFGVYATDRPIAGDWDGNGKTTIGVYRVDGAYWHWYERNTNSAGAASADFLYGLAAFEKPIAADWNSDRKVSPGVLRTDDTGLHWYLRDHNSGGQPQNDFTYGLSGDNSVVGDWDGN
jgi:hypothetical protein